MRDRALPANVGPGRLCDTRQPMRVFRGVQPEPQPHVQPAVKRPGHALLGQFRRGKKPGFHPDRAQYPGLMLHAGHRPGTVGQHHFAIGMGVGVDCVGFERLGHQFYRCALGQQVFLRGRVAQLAGNLVMLHARAAQAAKTAIAP